MADALAILGQRFLIMPLPTDHSYDPSWLSSSFLCTGDSFCLGRIFRLVWSPCRLPCPWSLAQRLHQSSWSLLPSHMTRARRWYIILPKARWCYSSVLHKKWKLRHNEGSLKRPLQRTSRWTLPLSIILASWLLLAVGAQFYWTYQPSLFRRAQVCSY